MSILKFGSKEIEFGCLITFELKKRKENNYVRKITLMEFENIEKNLHGTNLKSQFILFLDQNQICATKNVGGEVKRSLPNHFTLDITPINAFFKYGW